MNTITQLSVTRLKRAKQGRYNPLSSIAEPSQIARKLDAFEVGYLKDAVNIWDTLEQRDDLIRAVVAKRKKAVGRRGWTVLIRDSVPPEQRAEAEEHAAAPRYFYENRERKTLRSSFQFVSGHSAAFSNPDKKSESVSASAMASPARTQSAIRNSFEAGVGNLLPQSLP